MASPAYVEAILRGALPDAQRAAFKTAFDYVLNNLRIGRPVDQERAENLQNYFVVGTTAGVANQEFTVAHGLGTPPYIAIPVLPLQSVNITLPQLTVTRAADGSRIYLKSPAVGATFCLMIEA